MSSALSSRGPKANMESLERQLICPVCVETFSKPVVILPCQHNLCRKCAHHVFQASNPLWQTRGAAGAGTGAAGHFRCPSCRQEVALDRHGVFGLQRNLLVENIIDIYRNQVSSRLVTMKPEEQQQQQQQQQQQMCEEHQEEKINIYCLSCQTPTCSMCKVFGRHRDCEVAPIHSVYLRHKAELSDAIAALVASNDNIQALISQMEEICCAIEENGKRGREQLLRQVGALFSVLEQRKQELLAHTSTRQDRQLQRLRRLIRLHGDRLEAAAGLVEAALQSMEEPHMVLFLQGANDLLDKMALTARTWNLERPDPDHQRTNHLRIHTEEVSHILHNMDFCSDDREEDSGGEESEHDVSSSHSNQT